MMREKPVIAARIRAPLTRMGSIKSLGMGKKGAYRLFCAGAT